MLAQSNPHVLFRMSHMSQLLQRFILNIRLDCLGRAHYHKNSLPVQEHGEKDLRGWCSVKLCVFFFYFHWISKLPAISCCFYSDVFKDTNVWSPVTQWLISCHTVSDLLSHNVYLLSHNVWSPITQCLICCHTMSDILSHNVWSPITQCLICCHTVTVTFQILTVIFLIAFLTMVWWLNIVIQFLTVVSLIALPS